MVQSSETRGPRLTKEVVDVRSPVGYGRLRAARDTRLVGLARRTRRRRSEEAARREALWREDYIAKHDVRVDSDPTELLGGVSDTALGAAEMRAEESLRSDRLVNDPYAAAFVAAAPPLFPDVPALADETELAALVEAGITGVAVRTRFFDDQLEAAWVAGCRQVVLRAAGLDTRAFRLDWPDGVRLFELDWDHAEPSTAMS